MLKEPGVSDEMLINRAKVCRVVGYMCVEADLSWLQGLLITGAIFKQTVPDESDEERRALER